jgi:hypothetical protein
VPAGNTKEAKRRQMADKNEFGLKRKERRNEVN